MNPGRAPVSDTGLRDRVRESIRNRDIIDWAQDEFAPLLARFPVRRLDAGDPSQLRDGSVYLGSLTDMVRLHAQAKTSHVLFTHLSENWGAFSSRIPDRTADWGRWDDRIAAEGSSREAVLGYLDDPGCKAVVTPQHTAINHPTVLSIPIGVKESPLLLEILRTADGSKTQSLLINNSGWAHRAAINDSVRARFGGAVANTYGASQREYYRSILRSRFVLCPSGIGWDTHRIWETLLLGSIPVVERSPGWDAVLADLPVLLVASFTEVTPELLDRAYAEIIARRDRFTFGKLTTQWWVAAINGLLSDSAAQPHVPAAGPSHALECVRSPRVTTYVYFHICCINNWEDVVGRILGALRDSGLYDELAEIRCAVLGSPDLLQRPLLRDPKLRIIFHSEDLSLHEVPILTLLHRDSQSEDFYVLYLHSKGVTKPANTHVTDWVRYMLFFNVQLYRFAVQALAHHDSCGVNHLGDHYSGNFWWSKSAYIRDLTLPASAADDYLAPELWLTGSGLQDGAGLRDCKPAALWASGVNHYDQPYGESVYAGCVDAYDMRFRRLLPRFDHVVVNNYECGVSSSSLLPAQPLLRISAADTVIVFYRNIFVRAIGTFAKHCAPHRHPGWRESALLREVAAVLGPNAYRRLRNSIAAHDFPAAFILYVGALRDVCDRSSQTEPQARLLEAHGLDRAQHFIELEHNLAFFRITGCRFPFHAHGRANRAVKESLLLFVRGNAAIQQALRDIYAADLRFFERLRLRVDEC